MNYKDYLYEERLPHIWCPGCSNGIVFNTVIRAIADMDIPPEKTVIVSGSGCFAKVVGYPKTHTIKMLHGRALAGATGIALANPDLKVFVLMGDGDCATIGGNHLIHCARRNINLTAVMCDNFNYGMTGGQYSGTTPKDSITTTSRYGLIEEGFDTCKLVQACGASYVARTTAYDVLELRKYIIEATENPGFGFVEVMASCPVHYGRWNKLGEAPAMMKAIKDRTVNIAAAANMTPEQLEGKTLVGKFTDKQVTDYFSLYDRMREEAKRK